MSAVNRKIMVALVVGTLSMTGCGMAASTVRKRHATEFGCQAESVNVKSLASKRSYEAVGCGTTAKYVCADDRMCIRDL